MNVNSNGQVTGFVADNFRDERGNQMATEFTPLEEFARVPAFSSQHSFVNEFSSYFRMNTSPRQGWDGSRDWKFNVGRVNGELKYVCMEYKANIANFDAGYPYRLALWNHMNSTFHGPINDKDIEGKYQIGEVFKFYLSTSWSSYRT